MTSDTPVDGVSESARARCPPAESSERYGSLLEEGILLLPEISGVKQPQTIIAPIGTFEPALNLILTVDQHQQAILLTKLIERSHYFERIQFSNINP